ncbi:MAG TPA: DNA repair exonuclease [Candidatus Nanopusillus sp.]|nr:DNA repair exonuclease [Candidatus Nanopusillus sp.]
MRFIHVSDTHLGCEIPIEFRDIRKEDFVNAFKQIVNFAIKERVDFIIHSGDFFDDYFRISSGILEDIIDSLIKLKERNIPIILIKGNHDVKGHRQKMINILSKLDLVRVASSREAVEANGVYIYGISEPANVGGEELRSLYKNILPKIKIEKDGYAIFIFHGAPDILVRDSFDPRVVPVSVLPKNIDYYAFGHFHFNNLYKENNKIFALPGSTERTEISRREEKSKKGFYIINDGEVEFKPIKTRNIAIIERVIKDEKDVQDIIKYITSKSRGSIIKLKIRYKRELYEHIKLKIEKLLEMGYMIIEDLYPEDEDTLDLDTELEKSVLEDIMDRLLFPNKEEVIKMFHKIREIMEDVYSGKQNDIEKIRDILRRKLIK